MRSCAERLGKRTRQRTCHSQEDTQVDTSLARRGVEAHTDARDDDSRREEEEPRIEKNCGEEEGVSFILTGSHTPEHVLNMTVSLLGSYHLMMQVMTRQSRWGEQTDLGIVQLLRNTRLEKQNARIVTPRR